jgi:hypothetical protein
MIASGTLKTQLSRHLGDSQKRRVQRLLGRVPLFRKDLTRLAEIFGTDKGQGHSYVEHYQRHFEPLRREKLNVLEIGIGGHADPRQGGKSLRMWKAYFPKSNIFGLDIYEKRYHEESRIKTFQGSQVDESFLKAMAAEIGKIDIIIDDGSHLNAHVVGTFKIMFPLLSSKGIYAIEDLQTSYWQNVNGETWDGSNDLHASHTSMNFLKSLVDGLNYEEFPMDEYKPCYFDRHIVAVHFYHNLVFIYKGQNNEGSNILGKRFGQF